MDSQIVAQRDFSAGQIDDTALRRDDTDVQRSALRKARNVRILNSGAVARRPGRRILGSTTGIVERVRPTTTDVFDMKIEPGSITFQRLGSTLNQTFGGMPWGAGDLGGLSWVEVGPSIIVAMQTAQPQVFTYDSVVDVWVASAFTFATDPNSAIRQPFYNFFLGSGITMDVSARSGDIDVTFSKAVLAAQHIGVRFRYAERQIRITGVSDSRHATARVIEKLPPTFNVKLASLAGLEVGDVVEGVTSGAKGQVVALDQDEKIATILTTKNWDGFDVDELVVGPRSKAKATIVTETTPRSTVLWDEALMSGYRGWPGCVSKDAQRVVFTRFKQLGNAIVWSSTGTLNDFRIGPEKEDAIFELITENCTIQDVIGGADEFIFTDAGIYYVPVSTSSPLIPGSIEFRKISSDGAAAIRPQPTLDGYVFVNKSRSRVLALVGTGQTALPYVIEDISEFHSSIIRNPVKIATASSDISQPERYLYVVNGDGTMAVARYQKQSGSRGWVGWVPWDGIGAIKWVTANGPDVVVTTDRGGTRLFEAFEEGLILDGCLDLTSPLLGHLIGHTLTVEGNGWERGDYVLQSGPVLQGDFPPTNLTGLRVGFNFVVEVEPFVPHVDPGQSRKQRLRRRRIKQYATTVYHRGTLKVGTRRIAPWLAGENQEIAPPERRQTYRGRMLGRDFDPRWSVLQERPGALAILELTTEVTL